MDSIIINGIIGWFLPGVAHILQGKWERGIILGAIIWLLVIVGILSGGANFPGYGFKDGFLLYLLHSFATVGNGLGYIISLIFHNLSPENTASWSTFEYGGKCLEVAGLLNFLAVIDSADIALGRKN
jgi:hypothetical protein